MRASTRALAPTCPARPRAPYAPLVLCAVAALVACDSAGGTAIPCATNQDCPAGTTCSTAGASAHDAGATGDAGGFAPVGAAAGSCVTVAPAGGGSQGACEDVAGVWAVAAGGCFPAGELGTVAQVGCTVTITPASTSATITQSVLTADGIAFRVMVTTPVSQDAYDCETTLDGDAKAAGSCLITPGGDTCEVSISKE